MSVANKVVLIDPGYPQTIYLADELAKSGFFVHLVTKKHNAKILKGWVFCSQESDFQSESFVRLIELLLNDPEVVRVIPLCEESILACSKLNGIDYSKIFPVFDQKLLTLINSKHAMAKFAASIGVLVPEFIEVDNSEDSLLAARNFGYPVVLKGSGGAGGSQVAFCNSDKELTASFLRLSEFGPVVQRFVSGQVWLANGYFINGVPVRIQIAEVLEQYPEKIGIATRLRNKKPQKLHESFLRLFRELRWNGFASTDFICGSDGEFYFMEVNPRPWASITAAIAAGTKIFDPLCCELLGKKIEVDLDNRDSWESYVFPAYLNSFAHRKRFFSYFMSFFKPLFWRGTRNISMRSFRYILRSSLWSLFKGRA